MHVPMGVTIMLRQGCVVFGVCPIFYTRFSKLDFTTYDKTEDPRTGFIAASSSSPGSGRSPHIAFGSLCTT